MTGTKNAALATYTRNAAAALAALQAHDTVTLQEVMQGPAMRYATRLMMADWAVDIKSDPEAYQDIVQDVAVMLLTAADAKYGRELVPLRVMSQAAAYKCLVGRAKRIAMKTYGIDKHKRPMLTEARDEDGKRIKDTSATGRTSTRMMYRTLSLDGMGRNAQSAERTYLEGMDTNGTYNPDADTLHQAQAMDRAEQGTTPATVIESIMAHLTKGERVAFAAYLDGNVSGGAVTRMIKRLKDLATVGVLTPETLHDIIRAARAA